MSFAARVKSGSFAPKASAAQAAPRLTGEQESWWRAILREYYYNPYVCMILFL